MKNNKSLTVREIQNKDIELITNYWQEAEPEYLVSLGVDFNRLITRDELQKALTEQITMPIHKKMSYTLIWEQDGKQVGHSNINKIEFGKEAFIHFHLWQSAIRQKGIGTEFIIKSLPYFFDNFNLRQLFCEPYALNPAPNKTLDKIGFKFEKQYTKVPGAQNFKQEVKLWKLTKNHYKKLNSKTATNI
ncbi:MAG: GNAT family N-acetyltransferase [Planctomycetia bacterium]|nr:GNAT family N-acetyltransferase [Planctomycetia bacterium]